MFCDLKELTVEELVGKLRVAEDRMEEKVDQIVDKAGRLLLAEEDRLARNKHRFQSNPPRMATLEAAVAVMERESRR